MNVNGAKIYTFDAGSSETQTEAKETINRQPKKLDSSSRLIKNYEKKKEEMRL